MYIPSNIPNYEELKMELPAEKLELDWVYPFPGFCLGESQRSQIVPIRAFNLIGSLFGWI